MGEENFFINLTINPEIKKIYEVNVFAIYDLILTHTFKILFYTL